MTLLEQGELVGRSGRKRKLGRRHPSGELVREKKPDDRVRTSRQPHRRMLKSDDRMNEKAESPLGRMLLAGQLNEKSPDGHRIDTEPSERANARYQAGELYAKTVGGYRAQLGLARLRSAQLPVAADSLPADDEAEPGNDRGCASAGADPIERKLQLAGRVITLRAWPCQAPGQDCGCARRKARYDGAFEALATAGRRALMAVNRVAVQREPITPQDIVYLDLGLDVLARHFGLTGGRRRRYS